MAATWAAVPAASPVTFATMLPAVVMGVATAPYATGAVFASSTARAAFLGFTPSARIIVAVTAMGAPNPASASSRPPKQNAIIIA